MQNYEAFRRMLSQVQSEHAMYAACFQDEVGKLLALYGESLSTVERMLAGPVDGPDGAAVDSTIAVKYQAILRRLNAIAEGLEISAAKLERGLEGLPPVAK